MRRPGTLGIVIGFGIPLASYSIRPSGPPLVGATAAASMREPRPRRRTRPPRRPRRRTSANAATNGKNGRRTGRPSGRAVTRSDRCVGDEENAIPTAIPARPRRPTRSPRLAAPPATLVPLRPARDPDDVTDASDSPLTKDRIEYILPPITVLEDVAVPVHAGGDEAAHARNEEIIVKKLAGFGIPARIVARNAGPVVTQYEVQPARTSRSPDRGAADDRRWRSPPARSGSRRRSGQERSRHRDPEQGLQRVPLRRVLEEVEFTASESKLTFALGRDVAGVAKAFDMAKMPHLLIAGATGSGKSGWSRGHHQPAVKATPDDVRRS